MRSHVHLHLHAWLEKRGGGSESPARQERCQAAVLFRVAGLINCEIIRDGSPLSGVVDVALTILVIG